MVNSREAKRDNYENPLSRNGNIKQKHTMKVKPLGVFWFLNFRQSVDTQCRLMKCHPQGSLFCHNRNYIDSKFSCHVVSDFDLNLRFAKGFDRFTQKNLFFIQFYVELG